MKAIMMPLKTPSFWYKPPSFMAYLLLPLAWLYQLAHRIYQSIQPAPHISSVPIICIGNAVAGGSGKTPTAIALMLKVLQDGTYKNPCFLTRGYGGEAKKTFFLNEKTHNFSDAGDEAFLLAKHAQVIVSANRADGARLAEKHDIDLIIMDDGLQNTKLHKDITFLVIDRNVDFGNGKTIPAGPLREPLSSVLPKSDAVITIGRPLQSDLTVFESDMHPLVNELNGKYIAFAGLGRPRKFLDTLHDLNAEIIGWHEFADHHLYTQYEIDELLKEAKALNAELVTTEKDHIRLPNSIKNHVKTLPIEITFKNPNQLVTFIKNKLNNK